MAEVHAVGARSTRNRSNLETDEGPELEYSYYLLAIDIYLTIEKKRQG